MRTDAKTAVVPTVRSLAARNSHEVPAGRSSPEMYGDGDLPRAECRVLRRNVGLKELRIPQHLRRSGDAPARPPPPRDSGEVPAGRSSPEMYGDGDLPRAEFRVLRRNVGLKELRIRQHLRRSGDARAGRSGFDGSCRRTGGIVEP